MMVFITLNLFKLLVMIKVLITDCSKYIVSVLPRSYYRKNCILEDTQVKYHKSHVGAARAVSRYFTNMKGYVSSGVYTTDEGWHPLALRYFTWIKNGPDLLTAPLLLAS